MTEKAAMMQKGLASNLPGSQGRALGGFLFRIEDGDLTHRQLCEKLNDVQGDLRQIVSFMDNRNGAIF